MEAICQLYMPAFYRSYGKDAVKEVICLLRNLKKAQFKGVYLIALWEDGGYDNGFDVVNYAVNPKFGTDNDFDWLIKEAHHLGLTVGVDVVPNHVSDRHLLARRCLNNVPGYEDCLCVVSREEAARLTEAGVPSFFGKRAYSDFGDKYVRTSFADYHQLNLNWRSQAVRQYFVGVFDRLKGIGIDFVRVDCGMMLLEDVSQADRNNPLACMRPRASVEAVLRVAGEMPLFFEWFEPRSVELFDDLPRCYALDCSYVMTGEVNLGWEHRKLIPLLGGHDQMTVADRGLRVEEVLRKAQSSKYAFLDMQTLIGWKTESMVLPDDAMYDADLKNPNQRYRARREIAPVVVRFKERFW